MDLAPITMRWQTLRLEFMSKWYARYRDCSRYINPKRGFFEGFVPNYNAQIDYRLVMDADIARFSQIMAAGMSSGLTSRTRPWYRLALENKGFDDDDEVKDWLALVERKMYRVMAACNIYDAYFQTYDELGIFGTGSFGLYEDFHTVVRARSYTIGEYYLGTDYTGRVNSFARQYWMTTDQLVYEFGWNNVSDLVKRAYNSNQHDVWFLVYELVEENLSRIEGFGNFKGMKFRSCKWEAQQPYKKTLEVRGYNEFPIMAPRWDVTTTADTYGVGPGFKRLGDVKMIYDMEKDLVLAINKVSDPPIVVDASVENGSVNTLPGGITRSSAVLQNAGARPAYQVQPDVKATDAYIEKRKQQVAGEFFVDLFMTMLNEPEGNEKDTAREVAEKHEEKMLMLGPVLGRIQSDMLNPSIERIFAIMMRSGLIPPAPKQIMGQQIKVEYVSILAQAQQMVETAPIEQTATFIGALNGVYPEAKDNFDADEAVREYANAIGLRGKIVRPKDAVQHLRDARNKQAQAQQQKEDMMAATEGAANLSKATVGGGNALERLMGIQGGGNA